MDSGNVNQAGLSWLLYASMTVFAWGVYGNLLHTGQIQMADPVNGRYKAFLFVGVAYFLVAILGPIIRCPAERFRSTLWPAARTAHNRGTMPITRIYDGRK